MIYNVPELYFALEIKNNSEINIEIDYLNIYRTNGNKKHTASFQKSEQKGINLHKLRSNEELIIKTKELKGSRSFILNSSF